MAAPEEAGTAAQTAVPDDGGQEGGADGAPGRRHLSVKERKTMKKQVCFCSQLILRATVSQAANVLLAATQLSFCFLHLLLLCLSLVAFTCCTKLVECRMPGYTTAC